MEKDNLNIVVPIKVEKRAYVYIKSTKRNLFCLFTDFDDKKVKFSGSFGLVKTSNLKDYVAAKVLGQLFVDKLSLLKYGAVFITLNGLGSGRIPILNSFRNSTIKVQSVQDVTLPPHNGCRPKKLRRKKHRTKITSRIKKLLSPRV